MLFSCYHHAIDRTKTYRMSIVHCRKGRADVCDRGFIETARQAATAMCYAGLEWQLSPPANSSPALIR